MLTMYRPFGQMFDDFAGFPDFGLAAASDGFTPAVDVREESGWYVLDMELPGVEAKDLEVTVRDGVLTVKGERHTEREEMRGEFQRREQRHGSFARAFSLPGGTDPRRVEARLEAGVLTLRVPRAEDEKPYRVEVKVAGEPHGWLDRTKRVFAKAAEVPLPTSE